MNFLPFTVVFVGFCSLLSFGVSWLLVRRWKRALPTATIFVSGLLPTFLILAALTIGHILWLRRHEGGYSPLAILIYSFGLFVLNIACNLVAAAFPVRRR